jgi:RND family efflux transporter MFP subunit
MGHRASGRLLQAGIAKSPDSLSYERKETIKDRHTMNARAAEIGLARVGIPGLCLLLLATIAGCRDTSEPPPRADRARPVKTLVVPAPSAGAGIELVGRLRPAPPIDLAFEEVSGRIVELPIAGREGQEVLKGELLAQIDPKAFQTALRDAEDDLREAYSVMDLAQAEDERMEKMKGINPDLVSTSMLERTRGKLEQAEARRDSLETAVEKAEDLLERTSLRAPFDGIIARCLVDNRQAVQAGEPVVSLQDTSHLEVLVDAPAYMMETGQSPGAESISATARFPSVPDATFPLTLKEAIPSGDPDAGTYRLVLEMPKPEAIDLPDATSGTVSMIAKGSGMHTSSVLIPAIAVVTDPDGKDYVWQVDEAELRVHRRDVRIGRLAGSDQIQVLNGLAGGERIVVAGATQLVENRRVRLWEEQQGPDKAK